MLKYIIGAHKGRKASKSISYLVQQIVNHLSKNGVEIKIEDTMKILEESYAFCHTLIYAPNRKIEEYGSITITSNDILKKWLKNIYPPSYQISELYVYIDDSVTNLQDYWIAWMTELAKENPDKIGKLKKEWAPAINSYFCINIQTYIFNKYSYDSDAFTKFLLDLAIVISYKLV